MIFKLGVIGSEDGLFWRQAMLTVSCGDGRCLQRHDALGHLYIGMCFMIENTPYDFAQHMSHTPEPGMTLDFTSYSR